MWVASMRRFCINMDQSNFRVTFFLSFSQLAHFSQDQKEKHTIRATLYQGPFLRPISKPQASTNESAQIAQIWAQGLYIESRPTSPKAYVAGDMAAFWRERNGPKPKNWVEGLGRPTSHLPAHFTQLPLFSHLLVLSNILSFSSSKGIIHLSPSGPWIGPYNIKSLSPFGRPTLKQNFQFGPYKWAYGLYIARPTLRPTL